MDDSRSSDVISFVMDGKPLIYLDENQWQAMQDAEKAHAEKFNWNRAAPNSPLREGA
jgi:hypothetical protein